MLRTGIVGLPNVGKSTLFNALTSAKNAQSANYPFCTIEPNVGVVSVPDERLEILAKLCKSKEIIPTAIEFVDIAGLVKGASKGEGLGNQFLHNIREVDAIIQVVRCFDDPNTIHVAGKVDPLEDIETINTELALADMASVEKQIAKVSKVAKSGDKDAVLLLSVLEKMQTLLEGASFINVKDHFNEDEIPVAKSLNLMSTKPVIYACNMSEDDFAGGIDENANYNAVKEIAEKEKAEILPICAAMEAEISSLTDEEKIMFLEELGLERSGLDRMIQKCYALLGLISYLTAGKPEVRAWTITKGTKAPAAAGKIHSDFERGFIRAEVISYDDFINKCGGNMVVAKEKGLVRSEGKEYVMNDGDIVLFRFNV